MAEDRRPLALILTTGFNEYQQRLARGARAVLAPEARVLVVSTFDPRLPGLPPPVPEVVREASPSGVITTPCFSLEAEEQLSALLADLAVPVVQVGAAGPGNVRGDNETGMRALMRHLLLDRQVRRPVLIRGTAQQADSVRRERVFRAEMAERGLPVDEELILDGEFWHETAYRELRGLLRRRRDFDAVVAANDISALGALEALTDEGLRVPEDVLLTGFDNDVAAMDWPGLTTVDEDLIAQGGAAAEQLLTRMRTGGGPFGEVVLPSRLVVRQSTGAEGNSLPEQLAAMTAAARHTKGQLGVRDALRALNGRLQQTTSLEWLAAGLAESHLLRLEVRRCFLATYDVDQEAGAGLRARLGLAYRDGDALVAPPGEFPAARLLPPSLQGELDDGLLVLLPLNSPRRALGHVLFEQEEGGSGLVADALRVDVGRAFEALVTARELEAHTKGLERLVTERTGQLQQANTELERLALSDTLTGLANRAALERHLGLHTERLRRNGGRLSLLIVDVDQFKLYNDSNGHLAGDDALRQVAWRLAASLNDPQDLACRYGGEEFLVVLPGTSLATAVETAERFREMLAEAAIPHPSSQVAPVITASIGIASGPVSGDFAVEHLMEAADRALYQAKSGGRNQIWTAGPVGSRPRPHRSRQGRATPSGTLGQIG